jgi:patatin-related protein
MAKIRRFVVGMAILGVASGALAQPSDPAPPGRRAKVSLEVPVRTAQPTKELRLGVVCYGGVSLAIYMNGIVREMQNLVVASRALEAGVPEDQLSSSARAYYRALADRHERDGVMTRVIVDSIAGTSAGGINGVFLAKALAHDLPLDSLRDLWFEKGDINVLMGGRFQKYWKLFKLLFTLGKAGPPLKGNAMLGWIYDALEGMDEAEAGGTLMPPDHELKLFVTTTDFYGLPRHLFAGDPPQVIEKQYANVLTFSFRKGSDATKPSVDQFDAGHNGALALAARATSSFPGAFPPVSLKEAASVLKQEPQWLVDTMKEQFPQYELDEADAGNTYFVDGGVLDNAPFGPVISDLRTRQAGREVERRLIYLQPDPGQPPAPPPVQAPGSKNSGPSLPKTILGALSKIPGYEGIAADLGRIDDANARVTRIRDIVQRSREDVGATLKHSGVDLEQGFPPRETITALRGTIERDLRARVGLQYPSYFLLRVDSVVEQFGTAVARACSFPLGGEHHAFGAAVVRSWAQTRGFVGKEASEAAQEELIENFDLGYTRRQIRFVVDAVDWLYQDIEPGTAPTREQLDAAKVAADGLSGELLVFLQGKRLPEHLQRLIGGTFCGIRPWQDGGALGAGAEAYAAAHRADLDRIYTDLGAAIQAKRDEVLGRLYEEFQTRTRTWRPEARDHLLVYYLGFPAWDAIVYPYLKLGEAGELQQIKVVRISPDDAKALGGGSAAEKLNGVKAAHFGAFLKRPYRENDYLWGRLDGAERLLALAVGDEEAGGARRADLKAAFSAILDEEAPALENVQPLIGTLRAKLAAWTE